MLMVVFGAGASYDSAPAYPSSEWSVHDEDRPPLANELFANRRRFVEALDHFPRCHPIVPNLRSREDGIGIERELQHLQEEAAEYPERHRQLAAVRYYLHFMLWECEQRWNAEVAHGVTNQKSLLDQIERWRKPGEQVCIVTFNYDLMLETALSGLGIEIETLSDYIADDTYKLIKLHGSVNWGRRVRELEDPIQLDMWGLVHYLIDNADSLDITHDYRLVDRYPIHATDGAVLFPAIAIPVESKLNFECPQEHLEALYAAIPEVDKLLVVGWRAAETPFLELLAQNLQQPVHSLIVGGNKDAALETAKRFANAEVVVRYKVTDGGFTELVRKRHADEFLSR